jgi:hypothetical protein
VGRVAVVQVSIPAPPAFPHTPVDVFQAQRTPAVSITSCPLCAPASTGFPAERRGTTPPVAAVNAAVAITVHTPPAVIA